MNLPYPGRPSGPSDHVHDQLLHLPFPAAAPRLRILLTGDATAMGTDKLAYSVNPELTALLVYRTGPGNYAGVVLDKRHAQVWGRTKQDLWFTALANMAHDRFQGYTLTSGADTDVHVVSGIDWPGTAHVMRLPDLVRAPLPFGAVVMLPDSNTMIYAVLRSRRSLPMLPFLHQTFRPLAASAPPVSDQLLWWRDGRVSGMSARPTPDGGVQIRHSPEFSRLIDHELSP
ncbi:hypothetical protein [Nocardiopsis ansamitocini]|uniref:Uncharacterized protein n=1 Tax=Nocardiopsis ansamitocini TaxID=1670832 RepID=A0A9W6P3J6_9ACTN|nr:hypothetical protein [Nocardiopsis ansamitocini]GLU46452.1 hypothetical protein Nans01_08030 [Nocardiopsis ansamitocini]